MTTTYTPDGQTPPAPGYVLPQDVIDLVIVETVNNPFVTSADNIAWLLLLAKNVVSVASFGATGDGSTNDLPAILATIAYLQALGGGVLLFPVPAAYYRITGPIVHTTDVWLAGVSGNCRIDLDSAAADFLTVSNGSGPGSGTVKYSNLFFTCDQVTTGRGLTINGSSNNVLFSNCILDFSKVRGESVYDASGNSSLLLSDCQTVSGRTAASESMITDSGSIVATGGSLTMAPGATADLIACNDGDKGTIKLIGVNLVRLASSATDVAFVNAHGTVNVVIEGCSLDTDQASGITALVRVGTGCLVACSGNQPVGKTGATCPTFINSGIAGEGSRIEMLPIGFFAESADFTLGEGYEEIVVDYSSTADPVLTFPIGVVPGQRLRFTLYNTSGATDTPTIANSPIVMGTVVPAVASGKVLTGDFCWQSLNPGFSPYRWIQIGTWGVGAVL